MGYPLRRRTGPLDLVLTDPPYFDYIAYSELGHFYAPWMKQLGLIDPPNMYCFPVGQLASPKRGASAVQIFADALALRLVEVVRTCKPTARIAFTYQNLSGEGWRALGIALAKARIKPFAIFPMFGDSGSALHKKGNSICWDCVVIAKVSDMPLSFQQRAATTVSVVEVDLWRLRLNEAGHPFGEGDALNMQHASQMMASILETPEVATQPELSILDL
jgi:putative DNA methylase